MLLAMSLNQRYSSAVHATELKVDPKTTRSNSDVLAAFGLADRALQERDGVRPASPLAVPLLRLFAGDNDASYKIVEILSGLVWRQARGWEIKLTRVQADDMAKACLAWHRDGTCKSCGGHGYPVIAGTTTIGVEECPKCAGTGRRHFEREFPERQVELARWVLSEMDRALGAAGPEAMRRLAPRLEL